MTTPAEELRLAVLKSAGVQKSDGTNDLGEIRAAITEQFEYYFSDENLPSDAFLINLLVTQRKNLRKRNKKRRKKRQQKRKQKNLEMQDQEKDEGEGLAQEGGQTQEQGQGQSGYDENADAVAETAATRAQTGTDTAVLLPGAGDNSDSGPEPLWAPINVIAQFNKVKKLSHDPAVILAALRESKKLAVSDDGKRVRRIAPVPENWLNIEQRGRRSVNLLGLPRAADTDAVVALLSEHGTVSAVRFSEGRQGGGQRQAVVEFENEEQAVACARAYQPSARRRKQQEATTWRRSKPSGEKKGAIATSRLRVTWVHSKKLPRLAESPGSASPSKGNSGEVKEPWRPGQEGGGASSGPKGQWVFDPNTGSYVAANESAKAEMSKLEQESKEMGWGSRFKPRARTERPRLRLKKRSAPSGNVVVAGEGGEPQGGDEFAFMTYAKGPDDSRVRHPDGSPGFNFPRAGAVTMAADDILVASDCERRADDGKVPGP
jgi:hypothetical protein